MKTKLYYFLITTLLLASCSKSIEEKLIGTYWFEPEDEEILYFEENGIVTESIYQEKATYSVIGDSIQIGISGWGDHFYFIKELTEFKLILISHRNDVWELTSAKEKDFLIGEWEGKLFNNETILEFSYGELTIENLDADWDEDEVIYDDYYKTENETLITHSNNFNFKISDDKNQLELISEEDLLIFKRR